MVRQFTAVFHSFTSLKVPCLNKPAGKIIWQNPTKSGRKSKKINACLIELGETPAVELQVYPVITDIKEMLEYDYKYSVEEYPAMSNVLSIFDDDYLSKPMIDEFIIDEQDHINRV